MNLGWQDMVAIALVLAAAVHLWRHLRRAGTCAGSDACRSCASRAAAKPGPPLVTIDAPRRAHGTDRNVLQDSTAAGQPK